MDMDIPVYKPSVGKTNILPFDIDEYNASIVADNNKIYHEFINHLQDEFKRSLQIGEPICTIVVGRISGYFSGEDKWTSGLHFLKHKAVENFMYILQTKGYPLKYKFKSSQDGYDSDYGKHETMWKELEIKLK
jgi:hypothetical protein